MADDIVDFLQCIYDEDACGQCTFCLAKAEIERLRAVLDAIDALHQPYSLGDGRTSEDCDECGDRWPCPTHLLIYPMTLDEAINTLGTVHK